MSQLGSRLRKDVGNLIEQDSFVSPDMSAFHRKTQLIPQRDDLVRDGCMMGALKGTFQNLKNVLGVSMVSNADVWMRVSDLTNHAKSLSCRMEFRLNVCTGFGDLEVAHSSALYQGIRAQNDNRPTSGTCLSSPVVGSAPIREDPKHILGISLCLGITRRGVQANKGRSVRFFNRRVPGV